MRTRSRVRARRRLLAIATLVVIVGAVAGVVVIRASTPINYSAELRTGLARAVVTAAGPRRSGGAASTITYAVTNTTQLQRLDQDLLTLDQAPHTPHDLAVANEGISGSYELRLTFRDGVSVTANNYWTGDASLSPDHKSWVLETGDTSYFDDLWWPTYQVRGNGTVTNDLLSDGLRLYAQMM